MQLNQQYRAMGVRQWLVISCLFSVSLVILRILITDVRVFVFLPWNLFLAFIPYAISSWIINKHGWINNKLKFALVFTAWLLFIPNSFYILTDLFHLKFREESSRWFDLTLILSFAWNGLGNECIL